MTDRSVHLNDLSHNQLVAHYERCIMDKMTLLGSMTFQPIPDGEGEQMERVETFDAIIAASKAELLRRLNASK